MKPKIERCPPLPPTTPIVVSPYALMQSTFRLARSAGSMSACNSSVYGRWTQRNILRFSLCPAAPGVPRDSKNVSSTPGNGPTYGGFVFPRTFLRIAATQVSCSVLLRFSQSAESDCMALDFCARPIFCHARAKSFSPRAAEALFAKYGSHHVIGFGSRHESDSLHPRMIP